MDELYDSLWTQQDKDDYCVDRLIADLDVICGMAKGGRVNERAAGQILSRAQLIVSFLEAIKPPQLKMVSGRG